jgi:uncharacterized membrane protein
VFLWLSLTPSLLPRTPFFQALVSAIALVFGYGLGWLVMLWLSLRWDDEVRDLVGFEQVGLGHVLTGPPSGSPR